MWKTLDSKYSSDGKFSLVIPDSTRFPLHIILKKQKCELARRSGIILRCM